MRLLTHNTLRCNAKDVAKGYPLKLEVEDMNVQESEFIEEFMKSMLPTLDWAGVLIAAAAIGFNGIPDTLSEDLLDNEEFLRGCHNLLMVGWVFTRHSTYLLWSNTNVCLFVFVCLFEGCTCDEGYSGLSGVWQEILHRERRTRYDVGFTCLGFLPACGIELLISLCLSPIMLSVGFPNPMFKASSFLFATVAHTRA